MSFEAVPTYLGTNKLVAIDPMSQNARGSRIQTLKSFAEPSVPTHVPIALSLC